MLYYNRAGQEVKRETWQEEWTRNNRDIASTTIRHKGQYIHVWTTWSGINLDPRGVSEAPLIYETQVLGDGGVGCKRLYATEAEARKGHQQALESHGYPAPKGLRRYAGWRKLADTIRNSWDYILYPSRVRDAGYFVALWSLVTIAPIAAFVLIGPAPRLTAFYPFWSNVLTLAFDLTMLSVAVHGLLWVRKKKHALKAPSDA